LLNIGKPRVQRNETAKTGALTGGLADALNWAGVNEEKFQEQLDACNTEQERAALITSTLNSLYSETAAAYKETNAEVIRANQANEEWMASLAGVGGAIEPILTDIKMMGATLLSDAVPSVQALADAFRGLLNGDEGATADFGAAVSDLVTGLITKITEAIPKIAETGLAIITALATSIWQQLPVVLAQGREILLNLSNGIRENLPTLVSQALDIITNFAQSIYNGAPKLIETGFEILSNLVAGIMSSLPELIARVPEIISTFANTINDNFPTILMKGAELILQIIQGIISAIPTLVANIPKIITAIVDVWEAFNWLNLGKKATTFLKDGVLSMASAVKSAGKNILDTITNAIKNLPQNLLNLGKKAVTDLGGAIKSGVGSIKTAATSIMNGVIDTIKGLPSKMLTIGKDLVKGLWNGISDMTGWIIGKIQSFGSSVLSGIKSFFGIKSPSRVFRDEVGAMLAEGMAEGIEASADAPLDAMAGLSNDLLAEADGLNGLTLERKMQHTFAEPAAATAGGSLLDKLDRILAAIERGQILTIDKDLLIGGTAADYDKTLGQRRVLAARGAI
jgi:phage-related protein